MGVQWVHLGGEVLLASRDGAWLQPLTLTTPGLAAPMPDAITGSPASTRHLLDGAIAAAERAAAQSALPTQAAMTARRWAWQLVNQWHSASASLALLPELIARFRHQGRDDLAGYMARKLDEERGHDEFPLRDLRALGYDADKLVEVVAPDPGIVAALDYARHIAQGEYPVEFLGYVYAMERRVIRIPPAWLEEVQRQLPTGIDATFGLRVHATALDHAHVAEGAEFVATLPAAERTRVARGCFRFTQIRCAGMLAPQPLEQDLAAWLDPWSTVPTPTTGARA